MILECLMPLAAVYARKYGERQSPASGANPLWVSALFYATLALGHRTLRGPRKSTDLWGGAMVSCSDLTRAASQRAKLIRAAESG